MFLLEVLRQNPLEFFAWVVGFIIALSVHEAAHAATANYLGDPTAKFSGRLTLNPLAHLDPFGTLLLFLAGFGWGKPVPINPGNFANPRTGKLLTSLAGPLSNLAVALLFALPYNFLCEPGTITFMFVQTIMFVNIVLMVFNLLPIPPLDGGGALSSILPPKYSEIIDRNGPIILFSVIAIDLVFKIGILSKILWPAIDIVFAAVNLATRFGG